MWIGISSLVVIMSILIMHLIASKWNIANRSHLINASLIALFACVPFIWINYQYRSGWLIIVSIVCQIGLSLFIALGIVLFRFSRDPERQSPVGKGMIVSPADGEVINIMCIPNGSTPIVTKNGHDFSIPELAGIEFVNGGVILIAIEMNILNVHVNRCPIEGQVKLVKPMDGKFLSLRKLEAPFLNSRCTTLLTNNALTIIVVQIASRLVRRVENFLQPGQSVMLGQRLGKIKFGSQVATIIPNRADIKLEVVKGQKVFAGTSILARYENKN